MTTIPKLTKKESANLDTFTTISAKIRYLSSLNWSRSQVASKLGIRYQWVRNVLITKVESPKEAIPNK